MFMVESAANDAKKQDDDFAFDFIKNLHTKATIKYVSRIGLDKEDGKRRPILIALQSEDQKVKLLGNLSALKGLDNYKGISVTEDLTIEKRKRYKDLANIAKERNQVDPSSSHVWRVRGSSKNGVKLKKIPKRTILNNQ